MDASVLQIWTGRELPIRALASTFVASFGRKQLAPSNHSFKYVALPEGIAPTTRLANLKSLPWGDWGAPLFDVT